MLAKLEPVDASLKIFGFEGNLNDIRPFSKQYGRMFKTSHLKRMVLDILREANTALSNKEAAVLVIERMKWEENDEALNADVSGRVKDVTKKLGRQQAS